MSNSKAKNTTLSTTGNTKTNTKSGVSNTKTNNITVNEPNINNFVGTKRGKKKSIAEEFADITVPTTSIEPAQTQTKKNTKSSGKNKNEEESEEQVYTKKGYSRPEITYTDQLSKEQIEERLEDYAKVDDIYKVPLGVHLRYFINQNGEMRFRMGGQLYKNTGLPDYVILNSGTVQWSVQVKDSIFYRKMTLGEIKNEYQNIIDDLIQKNKKLKEEIKKLTEKNNGKK
jgi:hypothetical protein